MQKLRVTTMLNACFDAKCIIRHEFVPENRLQTKFHKEVMRLVSRVRCVRPEFQESGSWYLLHDIAPAHSSGVDSEFLAKRGILVLSHPPHSPHLAPGDFFYSLN
jgi:histone-lysine N-methyltransferase SETMAR